MCIRDRGWRAGCRVANMEFIQFHPTCLYHSSEKSFLISEAVRGEGAKLVLNDGNEFLHKFDSRGVLAPRDIVARAIDHEMKRLGLECVYLDVSHKKRKFILEHFPAIHSRCLHLGFDITHEPIPVVPAAHYTCGGLITNIHGQTDVENLYAIGEVACTGMHGANRVASNSLLECLVFADTASSHIKNKINTIKHSQDIPQWDESQVTQSTEDVLISHGWDELRRLMWDFVGIVRTTQRLERAQHRIKLLTCEVEEYYKEFKSACSKYNIPGFRKGKAPSSIVENFLGRNWLVNKALESLIPDVIQYAIDEHKIVAVATPKVTKLDIDPVRVDARAVSYTHLTLPTNREV